ncbi:MAG TPA: YcnI family protein [Gaiellaceae bacterium]|nr:YcnI family protein [Gaiellaceae bacterium]
MLRRALVAFLVAVLVAPATAAAHVTVNPGEWEAGGFARFAVRVPNERDNADTTEITMQFPGNVLSASFQPTPGWERRVEMAALDEPIEEEGEEPITERIASVTWTGGTIAPGEFQEFGVSFQVPETPGEELVFPAIQTYSNGEVVRWIGPPDADTPAPRVTVLQPEQEEEGGTAAGNEQAATPPPAAAGGDDDGSGLAIVALILGIAGLLAGLAALGLALTRRERPAA